MGRIVFIFAALLSMATLAGCTNTEKGAVVGGAVGAAAGNAIGGNTRSTVIGGVIGAGAGALIGRSRDGRCIYRDRRGRRYVDAC